MCSFATAGTPDCSPLCAAELVREPRLVLAAREAASAALGADARLPPDLQAAVDAFAGLSWRGGADESGSSSGGKAAPLGDVH